MKRIVSSVLMCALAPLLFAETITVDNAEDELLVFTAVPATAMASAERVRASVAAGEVELRYVPPRAAVTGVSVPPDGALLGAFVSPGRDTHPVVLNRDFEDGYVTVSRAQTLSDGGQAVTVEDALVRRAFAGEPVIIDNDFVDWDDVAPAASFSRAGAPTEAVQTRAGETRTRAVEDSLYWGKAGTVVETVKLAVSSEYVYAMIETKSPIEEGAAYVLYAYDDRNRSGARYTIEIPVTDGPNGFVFLWTPDRDTPRIVGEFVREAYFLEARLDLSRVAGGSVTGVGDLSFDFASVYSGARVSEEFFHTTLYARDIVYRSPTGR
ncbi:MAG: hypothetical protein ACLFPO_03680 [Spirochaetaceae bacterium]